MGDVDSQPDWIKSKYLRENHLAPGRKYASHRCSTNVFFRGDGRTKRASDKSLIVTNVPTARHLKAEYGVGQFQLREGWNGRKYRNYGETHSRWWVLKICMQRCYSTGTRLWWGCFHSPRYIATIFRSYVILSRISKKSTNERHSEIWEGTAAPCVILIIPGSNRWWVIKLGLTGFPVECAWLCSRLVNKECVKWMDFWL